MWEVLCCIDWSYLWSCSCLEGRAKVNVVACIVATQNNFDTNFANPSCVKSKTFFRECPTLIPQDSSSHREKGWGWGTRGNSRHPLGALRLFTRDLFWSTWGTVPWLEHLRETFPSFPSVSGTTTEQSAEVEEAMSRISPYQEEWVNVCLDKRERENTF